MRALRLVGVGWAFHLKSLSSSGFFLMTSVFMPLLVATAITFATSAQPPRRMG